MLPTRPGLTSYILPGAPKAGKDYQVNTGMNERVGQSHTRQVGCSFLLSPPSQIQQAWQIPVGSDGIFSVGPRPVPGTEQEVTDTDRPKDWSDGGLARTGTKGAGTAIAASGTGQAQGVGGESV